MQDEQGRTQPPETGDERETLTGFLTFQRQTLEWKCRGLQDDQLRSRPIETTQISLLGLVRHMAEVERGWTRKGVEGGDVTYYWCTDEHPNAEFDDVATADVAEAFDRWRAECANTDAVIAGKDLTARFGSDPQWQTSIRWLLSHLIEEYARHNGHADLIREAIDGETGE